MRSAVRARALALTSFLLAASSAACVTGDLPPRPSIDLPCTGGVAPTELASAPHCGSINLVVANETVYWTEKTTGLLKSVPACGGTVTVLEADLTSPGALAVDDKWIFWVNGNTIMRRPLAGGTPTILVAATNDTPQFGDENDINALLVDKGTLFFGRYRYALRVPTAGGTPTVIGFSPEDDLGRPGAFALDATHLYQTEIYHYAISRELLDGSQVGLLKTGFTARLAPDRIAVSQDFLVFDAIAVVNGQVIWAKNNIIAAKPVDALEGDPFLLLAEVPMSIKTSGFVVSGNAIYLGAGDTVQKAPLSPASPASSDAGVPPPTVIATNQSAPSQFAANGANIYWRTDDCKIMRMAK